MCACADKLCRTRNPEGVRSGGKADSLVPPMQSAGEYLPLTTSRGCGIMAMPTEQAMLVHHLPYVHRSNGWLPHSWGWRHNLSKKTDLKQSVFFVFCKLPRLQGKLTNLLPRRPSGEEPRPGRARPRRGGTPLPQRTCTNKAAPALTDRPPTWRVSGR